MLPYNKRNLKKTNNIKVQVLTIFTGYLTNTCHKRNKLSFVQQELILNTS